MSAQNTQTILDAKTLWKAVLAELQLVVSPINYKTWLENTKAEKLNDEMLEIIVPTPYARDRLTKLLPLIQESVNRIGQNTSKVTFIIGETQQKKTPERTEMGPLFTAISETKPSKDLAQRVGLSPKYTFETFVTGNNNQLAVAIATAVAQSPGTVYNPVFFYGGVGLGKTHLMQAIGNEILKKRSDLKIVYCTGEAFTNELITAIQSGKGRGNNMTAEFREKFRKADVLLIDDIQFIAGKESTQEEFFHTFNALYMAQKQIVVTSDRPPKDFNNLEARITSRFGSGIIADVQSPDIDTRIAILRKKRDATGDAIPNNVLDFIAEKISSNIRELEGAYLQVLTYSKALGGSITIETAAKALGQSIREEKQKPVNINNIIKAVCNYYSVRTTDLKGERRTKDLVVPRQVAMYLIKDMTGTPLLTIGELLGGRDHTTIMHGVRKIENEVEEMGKTKQDILNIKQIIFQD